MAQQPEGSRIVSIKLNFENERNMGSALQLGSYNNDFIRTEEGDKKVGDAMGITWHDTDKDNFGGWGLKVRKLYIQNFHFNHNERAVLNPGSPFIYLPEKAFKLFQTKIQEDYSKITCHDQMCFVEKKYCNQAYSLPPISITIGEYMYQVSSDEYVNSKLFKDYCLIQVQKSAYDHIILGEPFMKAFYVTNNFEKNQIGIAMNTAAKYSTMTKAPYSPEDSAGWIIALIIVLFGVPIAIGAVIMYRKREQQKDVNKLAK
jgi:hypothetical protein